MYRLLTASVFSLAALLPSGAAGVARADPSLEQFLVGYWYGKALDDTGACGSAQGEFEFSADGTYAYRASYGACAGFAVRGPYTADGNWITLATNECNPPGPACGASLDRSLSVVNDNAIVLGGRQMYHRGG